MNPTVGKWGFIGTGNMAAAMIRRIVHNGIIASGDILVYDIDKTKAAALCAELGIRPANSSQHLATETANIVLAVKPPYIADVLADIREELTADHTVISIAAGISTNFMTEKAGGACPIVRTMPNTPAMVGEGMTAICRPRDISDERMQRIQTVFASFGRVEIVDEKFMDAVTALSGSSPAYIFLIIEAMADGGVLMGLPRDVSYRLAAQSVLGAAKMVLESGMHPGVLKDMVTSPGGTTIEALHVLEQNGLRSTMMDAVKVCTEKGKQIGRDQG